MRINPWLVTSVTDLSYYCCPECQYRSQNLDKFKIHALNNHERANDLFNRDEDEYLALKGVETLERQHGGSAGDFFNTMPQEHSCTTLKA